MATQLEEKTVYVGKTTESWYKCADIPFKSFYRLPFIVNFHGCKFSGFCFETWRDFCNRHNTVEIIGVLVSWKSYHNNINLTLYFWDMFVMCKQNSMLLITLICLADVIYFNKSYCRSGLSVKMAAFLYWKSKIGYKKKKKNEGPNVKFWLLTKTTTTTFFI